MKHNLVVYFALIVLLTLGIAACGPSSVPTPTTVALPATTTLTPANVSPSTLTPTLAPSPTATQTIIPSRTPPRITTPVPQRATATPAASIPRDQSIVFLGGESTNPRDYDPATDGSGGNHWLYSGLVAFDAQMKLIPDLAESWVTTDGMTYLFKLRRNAHFHNGRTVIAQDFIYSWERAANPKTQSNTVLTYLGDIVGVREMMGGKADHIDGLRAVDDYTLQVTIDAPKPYFLLKLTYQTAFVLDRENVESGPEWYRTPNGTGPYRLIRWDRNQQIVYERNDDYYLELPSIRYMVTNLAPAVGIRAYETGDIDIAGISGSNVTRVRDPKDPLHNDLMTAVNLCTSFLNLDVTQAPFDDLKVRQAFSLAFDRQKYIDSVLSGVGLPAKGLYPPGLPGYNSELKGVTFDAAAARKLLAESKYGGPAGMPKIVYTASGTGSDIGSSVAAQIQMWQQNLGVTVTVQNIEPDKYQDELYAGHHGQIFGLGWCADYVDPENFADALFHTGTEHNRGHYSNLQLDTLLEQARTEQDAAKRIQMYQRAEQIIIDDSPAIFTVHSVSNVLVKPHIQGYVLTPVSIALPRYLKIAQAKSPYAQATASAQSAQSTVDTLMTKAKVAFTRPSGKLEGNDKVLRSNLYLKNFGFEARFFNPADRAIHKWEYALAFREVDYRDRYRLAVNSDGDWMVLVTARFLADRIENDLVASGHLANVDLSPTGSNLIRLVVQENNAYLFVNQQYIATVDVSLKNRPGDAWVGTGITFGTDFPGLSTAYKDLTIYALP